MIFGSADWQSIDSEASDAIRSDGLVLGHVYSITGLLRVSASSYNVYLLIEDLLQIATHREVFTIPTVVAN